MEFVGLYLACFSAGLVDSVVGGGGLIQLPALMLYRPDFAVAMALGTNKFASSAGTTLAVFRFRRHLNKLWKSVSVLALVAFLSSWLGAYSVSSIPQHLVRPLILAILAIVGIYTFIRRDFGAEDRSKKSSPKRESLSLLLLAVIGFYDGFLGPGTGGFLIFTFISLKGLSFLRASAASKVVNLSTNLAAILFFGSTGHIAWRYGIPMAAANILGSYTGTFLANRHGSVFVRRFFLLATTAIFVALIVRWFA